MRIRPATPRDLEIIAAFDPEWSGVHPDMSGIWRVAREGGRRLGYIGLDRVDGDAWYLQRYYTSPEARGRGLGRALVLSGVRAARRVARGDVVTYVMAWNTASANALIGCGFRLYDPAWAWAGREGVLYLRQRDARASVTG